MNALISLTKNTFREAIRDKIMYTIVFFGLLFLLSAPLMGKISAGQEERIIANFGLAMVHVFGLFITIFVGSRLIFNEIDKKTIFLLIPKPVPRSAIILGKFFGLGAVLFCTTFLMSVLYLFLAPFSDAVLLTIFLIYLSFLLLLAIILFFSSFMSPLLSSLAGILMFCIGNVTFDFKLLAEHFGGTFLVPFANFCYYFFPNFKNLNLKNYILSHIPYSEMDIIWIILVTVLFTTLFLLFAIQIFARKQFS